MGIAERYYKDVTLKTVTQTPDNMGGIINTYVSSTIKAYVSQIDEKESIDKLRGMGMTLVGTHIMMCANSVTLNKNDRIVYDNKEFIIKSVPMNPANKGHHKFCYMEVL